MVRSGRFLGLLALLALGVAGCASTSGNGQPAASAAQSPAASAAVAGDDGQLICRSERVTGSNVPRKVCRTKAQMDAERRAAQEMMTRPRVNVDSSGS